MYGGGNVFTEKGHVVFDGSSAVVPYLDTFGTWSDGSVCPNLTPVSVPPYGTFTPVIDEGYNWGSTASNTNFEYPGWYVPAPGNKEGITIPSDWQNYRLPIAGTLHNDQQNTLPPALSIVDYLCAQLSARVGGSVIHPKHLTKASRRISVFI
jgi:hypothetical protein